MPNRIIKESICTSDSLDKLTWFEEVLFYRLIVNCDDYGRFDGRPSIIKNRLFPLKETLTTKTVSGAINKLASAGLVVLYVFENKPYLYLPTWNHHQNVRAKRSKYPAPEDARLIDVACVNTSESKCKQMEADVPVIQSNPNPYPNPNPNPTREAFDVFWSVYPKKVGKGEARKAFEKAKVSLEVLLHAIEVQKSSQQWKKDGGQYIPNPATWLNQGRWEDELQPAAGPAKTAGSLPGTTPHPEADKRAKERMERLKRKMQAGGEPLEGNP